MTQNPRVQLISTELIAETIHKAKQSPRLRTNYNFHDSMAENPHRFLNVMLKGTYIQPHRHLNPPKSESFLILEGRVAFFIFDDDGNCENCHVLDASGASGMLGIDIDPGIWHTLHVLSDQVVCFEVKPGPYLVSSDKEFAPWAPAEGDGECQQYQARLQALVDSHL